MATDSPDGSITALDGPVFVTGGTGFLGRHLATRILELGVRVRVLARDAQRASFPENSAIEVYQGDILSRETLLQGAAKCKVIFHCAHSNAGSAGEQERVALEGVENVLHAARAVGCRIVHVSSLAVYGTRVEGTFHEGLPYNPDPTPYATAKSASEQRLLSTANKEGIPVAVIQPSIIYGPSSPFWTLWLARQLQKGPFALTTDAGVCNVVFIDDVVDALIQAAMKPSILGRRALISGEPTRWPEFLDGYAGLFGQPGHIVLTESEIQNRRKSNLGQLRRISSLIRRYAPSGLQQLLLRDSASSKVTRETLTPYYPESELVRQTEVRASVDTTLAHQLLGWRPRQSLAQGMERTLKWLREYFNQAQAGQPEGTSKQKAP